MKKYGYKTRGIVKTCRERHNIILSSPKYHV